MQSPLEYEAQYRWLIDNSGNVVRGIYLGHRAFINRRINHTKLPHFTRLSSNISKLDLTHASEEQQRMWRDAL